MFTIKEVSQLSGFSADSIRYYEKLGIVKPARGQNDYRYFDQDDLLALKYIAVMKYADFSLAEIKLLMQTFAAKPSEACNQKIATTLVKKEAELIEKIDNLNQILQLVKTVQYKTTEVDDYLAYEAQIDQSIQQIFSHIGSAKRKNNSCKR